MLCLNMRSRTFCFDLTFEVFILLRYHQLVHSVFTVLLLDVQFTFTVSRHRGVVNMCIID